MGSASTPIVPNDKEAVKSQPLHNLNLILRHSPLGITLMAFPI